MHPFRKVGLLILLTCCLSLSAQAQQSWYDADVGKQLGVMFCDSCIPDFDRKIYKLESCQVSAFRTAYFDTIATYAQGRVVDIITHRPLAGVKVQVKYSHAFNNETQVTTVTSNEKGFFRLGWVGSSGPNGPQSNRWLAAMADGYEPVNTQKVEFGGDAYIHIELAEQKKLPKKRR